jgi:hypothetical protein
MTAPRFALSFFMTFMLLVVSLCETQEASESRLNPKIDGRSMVPTWHPRRHRFPPTPGGPAQWGFQAEPITSPHTASFPSIVASLPTEGAPLPSASQLNPDPNPDPDPDPDPVPDPEDGEIAANFTRAAKFVRRRNPFKWEGIPEVPVLRDQARITFALFYTGAFTECVSSLLPT